MPPTPVPLRVALFRRWQEGHPVADLAHHFGLPERTVRNLVRRFKLLGREAIEPSYPDRATAARDDPVRQHALELRRRHATWGAGLIRVLLLRDRAPAAVPTERTLQRWLAAAGLAPAPRGRRVAAATAAARGPHDVWQMDAKERIALASGGP
jgi:transposase